MRIQTAILFVLTFAAESPFQLYTDAQEIKAHPEKLIRGKTIDEWIAQLKPDRTLEARHTALQVLRNDGLGHDREKTLRAFRCALDDKMPTVRSLAAAGLLKAGRPTDPEAAKKLVEIISRDLTAAKPPQSEASRVSKTNTDFDFPVREIRALGVIGESDHIPALRKITMNKNVHQLLRHFAKNAIRQIERRQPELRFDYENSKPEDVK